MSNNDKKHNNLPRGNGYTPNREMPQSFPQTQTDPSSFRSTIPNPSRGTSTDVPSQLTWDRAMDHMRPLPTPDKNRNVYSVDEMHAIASGGVVDHSSKMPTLPNSGNRW